MPRPRNDLSDTVLIDLVRVNQPVTVQMLMAHLGCSAPFVRGLLNALADTGALTLAPPVLEREGAGRPPKRYCLPDWSGLPARIPVPSQAVVSVRVLESLGALGATSLEVLCAVLEVPRREVASALAQLVKDGCVTESEHEGLTLHALVA